MAIVKRTERGWGGHYIGAPGCLFRRNTLLEGNGQAVIVSTVGCYRGHDGAKAEEIGCDRYYETMVFPATQQGAYLDAETSREISFSSPWSIDRVTDSSSAALRKLRSRPVASNARKLGSGGMG